MTIKKMTITTAMLGLSLTKSALADLNTSGAYISTDKQQSNIQEQINRNIIETEQNIEACEVHLTEIKKIHKEIQYKLDNFKKRMVEKRLKLIRQDLKKYELELEKETNEVKKQELREIIDAIKEVNREIEAIKEMNREKDGR